MHVFWPHPKSLENKGLKLTQDIFPQIAKKFFHNTISSFL